MAQNLHSKYGRLALLAEQAGKKAFFVAPSALMSAMQAHFVPDEDGVVRVYSSIDAAIGACMANRGDIIYVLPGYTETLETAGAIATDVAGISIVGLGNGADRPTLTFSTDTAASMTIPAASISVGNIIGVAGIDGLTSPFNVTGDNCSLDIEWQDASATVEAATAVRLDTANNSKLKLVYKGFTAGNAAVRPVAVDDCDNVDIEIDGYGVVSTAWVNFVDAASTNVKVAGSLYTQGVSNFTRDVVDTVGGSTWSASIWDASFGGQVSGGSAAALASDDVSAVATSITNLQTDVGDPSARTNFQSLETMIGVPDAANSNLDDILRTGFDSSAISANADGSALERLEYLQANLTDNAGLSFRGAVDGGVSSTTTLPIASLSGFGNDFFNTKYYMQVLKNSNSVGNAPEREVRQITDYVSASGTFTVDAFSQLVEDTDEVAILHESVVTLGRDDSNNTIATTNVAANEDGSVFERLEQLQEAVNKGSGTALAANKSLVDALGTDGTTVTDAAVSVLGAIGADNANNAFASTSIAANVDGSVLERLEDLKDRVDTVDNFLDTEVAAIQADTDKIDGASLDASPVAGSLARFVASGGTALGTPLAASKSLVDAIGSDGTTLTDSATSVVGVLGVNDADNAFDSTNVVANVDGSVLERLEDLVVKVTAVDDFVDTEVSAIKTETDQIGTIVNTAGTATIGGVFGDFANTSLVTRLGQIKDLLTGVDGSTNILGADDADNQFASTNVVSNADGSIIEREEYMQGKIGTLGQETPAVVSKAYADLTGYDTAAAFTVTGDVMVRVFGVVGATGITCTSGTSTLSVGTTEDADAILPATTIDNADFAATDVWTDNNPEDDAGPIAAADWVVIGGGADIILTRNVDDITAGTLTLYCEWKRLSSDGAVVAA